MTSQAWSNFVWRIRAAGEYYSVNFDQACDVIFMVLKQYRSECFIEELFYNIPDDSKKLSYVATLQK